MSKIKPEVCHFVHTSGFFDSFPEIFFYSYPTWQTQTYYNIYKKLFTKHNILILQSFKKKTTILSTDNKPLGVLFAGTCSF